MSPIDRMERMPVRPSSVALRSRHQCLVRVSKLSSLYLCYGSNLKAHPDPVDMPRSAGLERARTTINVPANARELTSGRAPMSAGASIARSNTQITPGRPSPNAGMGGPASATRGLSLRRPGGSPNRGPAPPPKGLLTPGSQQSPY